MDRTNNVLGGLSQRLRDRIADGLVLEFKNDGLLIRSASGVVAVQYELRPLASNTYEVVIPKADGAKNIQQLKIIDENQILFELYNSPLIFDRM